MTYIALKAAEKYDFCYIDIPKFNSCLIGSTSTYLFIVRGFLTSNRQTFDSSHKLCEIDKSQINFLYCSQILIYLLFLSFSKSQILVIVFKVVQNIKEEETERFDAVMSTANMLGDSIEMKTVSSKTIPLKSDVKTDSTKKIIAVTNANSHQAQIRSY